MSTSNDKVVLNNSANPGSEASTAGGTTISPTLPAQTSTEKAHMTTEGPSDDRIPVKYHENLLIPPKARMSMGESKEQATDLPLTSPPPSSVPSNEEKHALITIRAPRMSSGVTPALPVSMVSNEAIPIRSSLVPTSTSPPEPTRSSQEPTSSQLEPTNSTPEPISSLSESASSQPALTSLLPALTSVSPEFTSSLPELSSSSSQPTSSLPELTNSSPLLTSSSLEPASSSPEPTSSPPKATSSLPEPTSASPDHLLLGLRRRGHLVVAHVTGTAEENLLASGDAAPTYELTNREISDHEDESSDADGVSSDADGVSSDANDEVRSKAEGEVEDEARKAEGEVEDEARKAEGEVEDEARKAEGEVEDEASAGRVAVKEDIPLGANSTPAAKVTSEAREVRRERKCLAVMPVPRKYPTPGIPYTPAPGDSPPARRILSASELEMEAVIRMKKMFFKYSILFLALYHLTLIILFVKDMEQWAGMLPDGGAMIQATNSLWESVCGEYPPLVEGHICTSFYFTICQAVAVFLGFSAIIRDHPLAALPLLLCSCVQAGIFGMDTVMFIYTNIQFASYLAFYLMTGKIVILAVCPLILSILAFRHYSCAATYNPATAK